MVGLLVWLTMTLAEDPRGLGTTTCSVEVTGMPVPVMSHHRLVVGSDGARPLAPRFELQVGEEALRLRVLGLRYRGERWVSRQECEAAGRAVQMTVEPLPAHVVFPCPPVGLTVECPRCPGEAGARVFLAEELPPVEMDAWTREIEVLLRAPGYHREVRRLVLHPGPNTVHVTLQRL